MNVAETQELLRTAAGLDRWLGSSDPEARQAMLAGWSSMLADVPFDAALRAVRLHYAEPDVRTITPGDVLAEWRAAVRREHQQEVDAANRAEAVSVQASLDAGEVRPLFGSAGQYLADMVAAVARGEDPATVTRPAGVRVRRYSPDADARERACRFPDVCACTHTECRDGWLDEERTVVNGNGATYPAVGKCPMCEDGLKMAEERGLVRKPRRAYAGGR